MTVRTALLLGALSTFSLPLQGQQPTTVAGFTPGSFRVTESGAAEYRIPIRVPPGIAGMEPKLALVYNSQAGNGLLGMGWNLEGLSAVARCPQTMAQDAVRGGVNYDANDRYCLDGQRLMLISGASYGADGAEYRTELESFSKVIGYGSAGNGPAWFKVWTKSGQIMEYGNTTDSRIEAQGKTTVRVWALNKASDTKGNYFTVSYTEDSANGDFYPQRIDYTGDVNAGLLPIDSVRFVYEPRPDTVAHYVAGSITRSAVRLSKVQGWAGSGSLVTEYRVSYDANGVAGRSRVTSVAECSSSGDCKPALEFTLQTAAPSWTTGAQLATFAMDQGYADTYSFPILTGDWNGDGRTDIARASCCGITFYVATDSGWAWHSEFPSFAQSQGYNDVDHFPILTGDWNGDGKTDIARVWCCGVTFYVATDSGWAWHSELPTFAQSQGYADASTFPILTGDWNGDGRTDIARASCCGITFYVATDSGWAWHSELPTFAQSQGYNDVNHFPILTGDWNGDGKTDIARAWCCGVTFYVATDSGWAWHSELPTFAQSQGYADADAFPILTGDWNGDGKTDIARVSCCSVTFYLSTGTGWTLMVDQSGFGQSQGYVNNSVMPIFTGDWNGDGLTDFARVWCCGVGFMISTGTGFAYFGDAGSYGPDQGYANVSQFPLLTGDWNGDGKTDFFRVWCCGLTAVNQGWSSNDLVTKVRRDGIDLHSLQFKPLTDASVYAKTGGVSYPVVELQSPLYVVASVASSNGVGGSISTNYAFSSLRASYDGRGLLGFRSQEVSQSSTGIKVRTEYRQDWPYVGMPSLVKTTQSSGAVLSQVANTLDCKNPIGGVPCTVAAGNRCFPFVSQSVQSGNDLNAATLPTVTTTTQYGDNFGNATSVVVSKNDGYSKSTTNVYNNDTTNWLLGRLKSSTVQSTTP